ncbi:MAG: restriction endonuclease subunit S, partial [Eubacteriales bacterium]|nr:restriction endonuclease subunit S [Eubacteriales bacterium]
TVSGLDNYELSSEEEKAIKDYNSIQFRGFDIIQIFDVKNTHNILSDDIISGSGEVPYLCAGAENNSVYSYISYSNDFLEKGNCVFIGGKTFTVTYQEQDFFSNDSHNLALYEKEMSANKLQQLYIATCVKRSLSHKYSWGDSVSKAKIKSDKIYLPTKDGKPDYNAMATLISAIQKLVIKDVVLYADRKIEKTKEITEKQLCKDN